MTADNELQSIDTVTLGVERMMIRMALVCSIAFGLVACQTNSGGGSASGTLKSSETVKILHECMERYAPILIYYEIPVSLAVEKSLKACDEEFHNHSITIMTEVARRQNWNYPSSDVIKRTKASLRENHKRRYTELYGEYKNFLDRY